MTDISSNDNHPIVPFLWKQDGGAKNCSGQHGDNMEQRVKMLEEKLLVTKADLGVIMATHATKADVSAMESSLHKALHALTWRMIGVAGALVAAVYFIAVRTA